MTTTTPEDRLFRWSVFAAIFVGGVALWATKAPAQPAPTAPLVPQVTTPAPTPPAPAPEAKPAAPAPLSADFQAGFCSGWNMAVQIEQQRFGNWRATVEIAGPAPPDSVASRLLGSVSLYVLMQSLQPGASLALGDGRTVACAVEAPK